MKLVKLPQTCPEYCAPFHFNKDRLDDTFSFYYDRAKPIHLEQSPYGKLNGTAYAYAIPIFWKI